MHDAVKAALPNVALAPLVDGSSSPKTTLTALARAVPAEDVDVFAFRPAGATAAGWTADDVPQLLSSARRTCSADAPPNLPHGAGGAERDRVRIVCRKSARESGERRLRRRAAVDESGASATFGSAAFTASCTATYAAA